MASPITSKPVKFDLAHIQWQLTGTDPAFDRQIQRTSDNGAGAPASTAWTENRVLSAGQVSFSDFVPFTTDAYYYRWRHQAPGYTAGAYSTHFCARPVQQGSSSPIDPDPYFTERSRRTDTFYESDAILQSSVRQSDDVTTRVLTRGLLTGSARDGDSVSFGTEFDSPPFVALEGGITYEPRSSMWSSSSAFDSGAPQYETRAALNITPTGFTAFAKLIQVGASASSGADFPSANTLSSEGANTDAQATVPTAGDQYTHRYRAQLDVTATGRTADVTLEVVVAHWTRATTSSTSWAKRATNTHSVTALAGSTKTTIWAHETETLNVTSGQLTTGADNHRIEIDSVSLMSAGFLSDTEGIFTVHGFNASSDPDNGVTYSLSTSISASMTPRSEDSVSWFALAGK